MKKIITFFTAILISSLFYAGQPSFLKNWIIPEDATWGEFYRLPQREGLFQTTGLNKPFDYVHVLPAIEMPPFFVKNHLANWKMPFSEILKAMTDSKDFSVYTEAQYRQFDNNRVLCSTTLTAIYKSDPMFKLVMTFPYCSESERDSRNPTSFQIHFSSNPKWKLPAEGSPRSSVIIRANQQNKKYTENEIKDFFNQNYKALWFSLPEIERYAIAFSSNLFETNRQFHLDFGNHFEFGNTVGYGKKTLNQSCGIRGYTSLISSTDSLLAGGHSKAYNDLIALLNKYPKKSVLKIAKAEHLTPLETSRLYWVSEMKDKLGSHGLEAWDEGRVITWIRWAVGAGYISYDEAIKQITPIVNNIRKNYKTWEDYMAHYVAGRDFYLLYSQDRNKFITESMAAVKTCRAYIPYETLLLYGTKADKDHVMHISDIQHSPSKEGVKWEEFRKLYVMKESPFVLEELTKLEKKYPEFSDLVYSWHLDLMLKYTEDNNQIYKYVKAHYKYFSKLPQDSRVYKLSMDLYKK